MFLTLVCCVVVLNARGVFASQAQERFITSCTAPNGGQGICVDASQCSLINEKHIPVKYRMEAECQSQNARFKKYCCNYMELNKFKVDEPTCGRERVINSIVKIVGGEEAQLGEFPWMVRIAHTSHSGRTLYGCGGFLVHKQFVITAAHCFRPETIVALGNVTHVLLGEHDTERAIDCVRRMPSICAPKTILAPIKSYKIHSGHSFASQDHENDLALIKLRNDVEFSDYVQPICLSDEKHLSVEYWLSGWGKTEEYESSSMKMKVMLRPVPFKQCAERFATLGVALNRRRQLCAGNAPGRDSCNGDSGGPLMYRAGNGLWYAQGVVSFGVGCGRANWPGVYTNLTAYSTWLQRNINAAN